ncbi:MAG: hypothetical protein AB2693_27240 [Candidatus Thiodiazotropha sp.]
MNVRTVFTVDYPGNFNPAMAIRVTDPMLEGMVVWGDGALGYFHY